MAATAGQSSVVRAPVTVLLVVFLTFSVQSLAIRGTNLGLDGGLSLALGIIPIPDALGFLAHDVHPPLFYLALRPWVAIVGTHPFAVKYLTASFGTLTVVVFAAWIRRFLGNRAAARGALLLAASSILVGDAATVRDLAPGFCFVVLNCWAYCETRRAPSRGVWARLYLGSGVLAIWTSFLVAGVLLGQAIDLLIRRSKPGSLGPLLLVGLSIVPWLAFIFGNGWLSTLRSGGPTTGSAQPGLLADTRGAVDLLVTGSDATRAVMLLAVLAVVALTLGPAVTELPRAPLAGFAVVELIVTVVFALGVSSGWLRLGVPARYLAPALAFWILLIVVLAEKTTSPRAWLALGVVLAVNGASLLSWYRQPGLPPSFWNPSGVQSFLDQQLAPGDHAVFLTLEQAGYYSALSPSPHPWVAIPVGTGYLQQSVPGATDRQIAPLLGSSGAIWLVEYHGVLGAGQRALDDWLTRRAYPLTTVSLSDSDVHPYLTGTALGPGEPLGARFADGVTLTAVAFPPTARPGAAIPVRLTWHAAGPLARDLTVFVHLVDQRGQTIAQQDLRPVSGLAPTTRWRGTVVDRHGLSIPRNTPTGNYWIDLGLYDAGGRLPVDGRPDGAVRIGPIAVKQ
ncbi:MAG TPA: glycosyltransferase family 39 protein [Chloroflexota bacterium]|nr:glycosyltransferase family 39 protein [Chloroflexota bacterium]